MTKIWAPSKMAGASKFEISDFKKKREEKWILLPG
jgi:hypothetical protein